MKNIRNLIKQDIHLEGFGHIEISETLSGEWHVDLFPRNSENDREKIRIDTHFDSVGDKYFEMPKARDRMKEIYDA